MPGSGLICEAFFTPFWGRKVSNSNSQDVLLVFLGKHAENCNMVDIIDVWRISGQTVVQMYKTLIGAIQLAIIEP